MHDVTELTTRITEISMTAMYELPKFVKADSVLISWKYIFGTLSRPICLVKDSIARMTPSTKCLKVTSVQSTGLPSIRHTNRK